MTAATSLTPGTSDANFATCPPSATPTFGCSGKKEVTIWTDEWAPGETLTFWWLSGTTDTSPGKFNCSHAEHLDEAPRRVALGTVTVGTGATSAKLDIKSGVAPFDRLPAGDFPAQWAYGTNWVCVTSDNGVSGNSGDQLFTIRPAG